MYWVGQTSSSHLIVFCTRESGFSGRDIGVSESETSEVEEVKGKKATVEHIQVLRNFMNCSYAAMQIGRRDSGMKIRVGRKG